MTDPDRFLALVDAARQAVEVLKRYRSSVPRERLLGDVDTQNMVLFALYRAVQACIDLGQHLISERALRVPGAYREVFGVLGEAGIVEAGLAARLQGWGGLRNVIAHQYGEVDYALIAHALHEELGDLEAFVAHMAGQALDS